jgi:competence protein ComFC
MFARLREWLQTTAAAPWGRSAADLAYPVFCPACDQPAPECAPDEFCGTCTAKAEPLEAPFCEKCAEPFSGEISGAFECPNCQDRDHAFDFAACGWISSGPVREAINSFKYERRVELRRPLGRLLLRALEDERIASEPGWVLCPVPLHPRRERERGFNQSAELAEIVARHTKMKLINGLKRVRFTDTQARLSRSQRLKNLKGAFSLTRRAAARGLFRDRLVLLVDDVFTTGATAHECAGLLKREGGARKVAALTVARG